jgi:hypothetical protein
MLFFQFFKFITCNIVIAPDLIPAIMGAVSLALWANYLMMEFFAKK